MRRFTIISLGVMTALLAPIAARAEDQHQSSGLPSYFDGCDCAASACASCCPNDRLCDCCCEDPAPFFSVTAEALLWHRTAAGGGAIFTNNQNGSTALHSSDLNFNFAPGYRVGLQVPWGTSGWGVELNYLSIDSWRARSAADGGVPNNFTESFAGFAFPDIASYNADYASSFQSGEVNVRQVWNGDLSMLLGFRMAQWNEDLVLNGLTFGATFQDTLRTDTNNRLYGLQSGLDAILLSDNYWRLNCIGKAGVYYNGANQTSVDVSGSIAPQGASVYAAGDSASFLGELGFVGSYRATNHLSVRAGYSLLWLTGVALAPDQLAVNDIPLGLAALDTSDVFAHGFLLGLEWQR